jgi:hypothetical protein
MMIPTDIRDQAPSDQDQYDRDQVRGSRYRQSQDYQQNEDYWQSQEQDALELVSTNDWWMLLLPNPWLEVRRL